MALAVTTNVLTGLTVSARDFAGSSSDGLQAASSSAATARMNDSKKNIERRGIRVPFIPHATEGKIFASTDVQQLCLSKPAFHELWLATTTISTLQTIITIWISVAVIEPASNHISNVKEGAA